MSYTEGEGGFSHFLIISKGTITIIKGEMNGEKMKEATYTVLGQTKERKEDL